MCIRLVLKEAFLSTIASRLVVVVYQQHYSRTTLLTNYTFAAIRCPYYVSSSWATNYAHVSL